MYEAKAKIEGSFCLAGQEGAAEAARLRKSRWRVYPFTPTYHPLDIPRGGKAAREPLSRNL